MIRQEKDIKRSVYWIHACCILHNLLLKDTADNEWLEVEKDEKDEDQIEILERSLRQEELDGIKKRKDLMSIVLSRSM